MRALGSIVVLAALLAFSSAQAAGMAAKDKAIFDQLSPPLQQEVKSRLKDGNTVRGVLETMLLNAISELFAANRIQAVDFDEGVAIVELPDGDVDTVFFETASLTIKE